MAETHHFSASRMFDMQGHVCVVTGGGTGIGMLIGVTDRTFWASLWPSRLFLEEKLGLDVAQRDFLSCLKTIRSIL